MEVDLYAIEVGAIIPSSSPSIPKSILQEKNSSENMAVLLWTAQYVDVLKTAQYTGDSTVNSH